MSEIAPMSTLLDANARFDILRPMCERAIRRALWHCQQADQEDATQVGLTEVWIKLHGETAHNTDSWFIWRATAYARDYATRQVYRYYHRHGAILSDSAGEDALYELVAVPVSDGGLASAEDATDVGALLDRLHTPTQQTIAHLLIAGWPRTMIAERLHLSYKAVIWQCRQIALLLTTV